MGLFSNECAACGSKEHSTSDCPHGLLSSKCASCGSKDHATKDCPHGLLSNECALCGSKNHATKDCPQGLLSTECASCGSKEHSSSDCPHGLLSSKCASCGSKDHATKDCPHGILGSRTFKKHQDKSYSSKEKESGGISEFFGKMIGYIIVGAIILGLIVWLALYIVLPISLLNSALVLTVIGFFIKKHRKLFSILALVGGSYMLLDVLSGWLSVLFIENIVKDNIWISVFVYINSIAIGFSVWVLVQPIWLRTMQMDASKKRKSILLKGVLILLVAIATAVAPVIYHSVQNPFNQKANNNQASYQSQLPIETKKNNIEKNEAFYIINVAAIKTENAAKTKVQELKNKGFKSDYLWIPDYASLSGATFYSVYIGPYSTQYDCEVATEEYRKKHPEAYGLLVSQDNKRVQIMGIGKVSVSEGSNQGINTTVNLNTDLSDIKIFWEYFKKNAISNDYKKLTEQTFFPFLNHSTYIYKKDFDKFAFPEYLIDEIKKAKSPVKSSMKFGGGNDSNGNDVTVDFNNKTKCDIYEVDLGGPAIYFSKVGGQYKFIAILYGE